MGLNFRIQQSSCLCSVLLVCLCLAEFIDHLCFIMRFKHCYFLKQAPWSRYPNSFFIECFYVLCSNNYLCHFLKNSDCYLSIFTSAYLLDMVHLGYLSTEGQVDLNPPDRRNLSGIVLRALRVPKHHSSNQGYMAGNPPGSGNKGTKGGRSKGKTEIRAVSKNIEKKVAFWNVNRGGGIDWPGLLTMNLFSEINAMQTQYVQL